MLVAILWITQAVSVAAQTISPQATEPLTDKELVRNGGFDQYKTAWATNLTGTHVGDDYGTTGPGMQIWTEYSSSYGYILQELYLPSQVTAATLSFDYKFLPQVSASLGWFRARIITDTGTLAAPLYIDPNNYPGETWQAINYTLTADELSAVNSAHDNGKRVYVIIDLYAEFLYANVDNVSFKVDGSMTYPALRGSIAYIGLDASSRTETVKRIDPDGSNPQTLWTHPSTIDRHIYDVVWKPDATELAFSSNHEFLYSAFHADVYGIQPDGSGLRRITNPPSKADLDTGSYQWGTVTGKIYNNYGTVSPFYVYIEGAREAASVDIADYQSEVSFRVENVADLGPATDQYIVFHWSDTLNNCASGKEYAAVAVSDVIAGQEVDVGTLTFNGNCYDYNSQSIAWKWDGSEVGFFVESFPKSVPASGASLGTDLFNIGTVLAEDLTWSPAQANGDEILYRRSTADVDSGFYLTTVGGGVGTRKASDRKAFGPALYATETWLPDGSGFIYTLDDYIYEYTLASGQVITLATFHNEYVDNPSVSPDGDYVVFERLTTGGAPIQYDLWILKRSNPVEMWPLTSDGKSHNPDWSQQAPSSCTPLTGLDIQGPTTATSGTAVTLNAVYTPTTATGVALQWDNGATGTSTDYTWLAGEHTAVLTATAACGNPLRATHTVQVSSDCTPLTGLDIEGPTTATSGTAVTLNAVYTPTTATGVALQWDNGATGASTDYTWLTGEHTAVLTATAACGAPLRTTHAVQVISPDFYIYLPVTLRNFNSS
jgi:hypothetical protein